MLLNLRRVLRFRFHWSSEIYGLGKTYRSWLGLPRWVPLLFTSDHGVLLGQAIDPELTKPKWVSIPHLTWTVDNMSLPEMGVDRLFLPVVHPWVTYRRARNYGAGAANSGCGTVFFPIHTAGGVITKGINDRDSIEYLKKLDEHFEPIQICMHFGEFNSERAREFQNAGFNVTTVGDPSKGDFVDNFYGLLGRFKYVISENYGSQVPFAVEYGIPVQILPREISEFSATSGEELVGPSHPGYANNISRAQELFQDLPSSISLDQISWAEERLGLANEKHSSKVKRKVLLWTLKYSVVWAVKDLFFNNLKVITVLFLNELKIGQRREK